MPTTPTALRHRLQPAFGGRYRITQPPSADLTPKHTELTAPSPQAAEQCYALSLDANSSAGCPRRQKRYRQHYQMSPECSATFVPRPLHIAVDAPTNAPKCVSAISPASPPRLIMTHQHFGASPKHWLIIATKIGLPEALIAARQYGIRRVASIRPRNIQRQLPTLENIN